MLNKAVAEQLIGAVWPNVNEKKSFSLNSKLWSPLVECGVKKTVESLTKLLATKKKFEEEQGISISFFQVISSASNTLDQAKRSSVVNQISQANECEKQVFRAIYLNLEKQHYFPNISDLDLRVSSLLFSASLVHAYVSEVIVLEKFKLRMQEIDSKIKYLEEARDTVQKLGLEEVFSIEGKEEQWKKVCEQNNSVIENLKKDLTEYEEKSKIQNERLAKLIGRNKSFTKNTTSQPNP